MDQGVAQLALACLLFVGSHFALSGPLRAGLVRWLGARGFLALYSLVAMATLGWAIIAFGRSARGAPLWDGTAPLPWIAASVLTCFAMVLIAASFSGNPALPGANVAGLSARRPWGVFRMTRHPMMMGIALWGLGHLIAAPTQRTTLLCLSFIVLALIGSALQDRRKLAANGREWSVWQARTSFLPDLSQAGALGGAWLAGITAWLVLTAAHLYLGGVPAGIWVLAR